MADEPLPIGPPADAVAALAAKGFEIGFDWRDVWQEENVRAFTVAKAMSRDLLEDIRAEVTRALDEGLTLKQFQDNLRPRLVARGWWGRARMVDPADGVEKVVRLGSPHRLRTIYQSNLRAAQAAGKWARIQRTKRAFPFLRYVSVMDGRERPEHGAWHGTILPVDDPWWDTHYPPCGWNCRCDVQPLNSRMIARRGWEVTEAGAVPRFPVVDYTNRRTGEVTRLERGIDPGWSYNGGKATLDGLTPSPRLGPPPQDGVGSELNSQFSGPDYEALKAFFEPFELTSREAATDGRIFTDVAGWPLAISAGLFRNTDGSIADLTAAQRRGLAGAARTLIDPDRIGWLWIGGRDGRAMLVRRYQGEFGSVDVAKSFWRWMERDGPAFARGQLAWTREDGVLNARRYVRDNAGRFSRTGSSGTAGFVGSIERGEDGPHRHDLDTLGPGGVSKLEAAGLSAKDKNGTIKTVALDRSSTAHILRRHGDDARGQIAIQARDFENMPALLETGRYSRGPKTRSRSGSPLIEVSGTVDRRNYFAVFEIRKHTVVPKSLSRRR